MQARAARVAAEPGDYGIVVLDVQTGRGAAVNESMPMPAAGTINVPVLYDLYRRASAGELSADDLAEVRDRFRSVDTSWYSLAGADRVRALMTRLGATGVEVRRGVEDGPAFGAGLDNGTDAAGLARVLASLARCELLSRDLCADAVAALAQQEFHDLLPRGLPPGTRFAHTTGSIAGIRNDAGIVYPADAPPFAIVLLTRTPPPTPPPRGELPKTWPASPGRRSATAAPCVPAGRPRCGRASRCTSATACPTSWSAG
ncbi:MAG: serine hydrolase [Gemmatimonadetes bacterium]|nr:serine hydrolase [Gemmatimonadota bacterium]